MRPLRAFRIPLLAGAGGGIPDIPTDYFRNYDLSNESRVFSDAYTTPAVADDPIYVVDDEYDPNTGNGAEQGTLANRPLWKIGVQNGLAVARFDGSNDVLAGPVDGTGATHIVIGVAFKIHATASLSGPAYFSWADGVTSGTPFALIKDDGTGTQLDVYVDGGYRFNNIATPAGEFLVLVLSFEETGLPGVGVWNLLVNGVAQAEYSGTIGMFKVFANNVFFMNGFGGYQNGDMGQAVFYTPSSDVSGVASELSAHLVAKWGA